VCNTFLVLKVAKQTLDEKVWTLGKTKFFGKSNVNELLNEWLRRRRATDIQRWSRYDCLVKGHLIGFGKAVLHLGLRWRSFVRRPKALLIQSFVRAMVSMSEHAQRSLIREHARTVQAHVCAARARRTWGILGATITAAIAAKRRGESEAAAVLEAKRLGQAEAAAAAAVANGDDSEDSDDAEAYVAEPAYVAMPLGSPVQKFPPQAVYSPPSHAVIRDALREATLSQFQPVRSLEPQNKGSQGVSVFCRYNGGSTEFCQKNRDHLIFEVRVCWCIDAAEEGPVTDPLREYDIINAVPYSSCVVQVYTTFQDSVSSAFLSVVPALRASFGGAQSRNAVHFVVYEYCPDNIVSLLRSMDSRTTDSRETEAARRQINLLEGELRKLEFRERKYHNELGHDQAKLKRKLVKMSAKRSRAEVELADLRDKAAAIHFSRADDAVHLVKHLCAAILQIGIFLERNRIVHRNLGLENFVISRDTTTGAAEEPRIKLTGFTEARSFSRKKNMTVKLRCTNNRVLFDFRSMQHLAPEVINGYRSAGFGIAEHIRVNFAGQLAWGIGSVVYKLLLGLRFPIPGYPACFEDPQSEWKEVCPFKVSDIVACQDALNPIGQFSSLFPSAFQNNLAAMLSFHPSSRPTVEALAKSLGVSAANLGNLESKFAESSALSAPQFAQQMNEFVSVVRAVSNSSQRNAQEAISFVKSEVAKQSQEREKLQTSIHRMRTKLDRKAEFIAGESKLDSDSTPLVQQMETIWNRVSAVQSKVPLAADQQSQLANQLRELQQHCLSNDTEFVQVMQQYAESIDQVLELKQQKLDMQRQWSEVVKETLAKKAQLNIPGGETEAADQQNASLANWLGAQIRLLEGLPASASATLASAGDRTGSEAASTQLIAQPANGATAVENPRWHKPSDVVSPHPEFADGPDADGWSTEVANSISACYHHLRKLAPDGHVTGG